MSGCADRPVFGCGRIDDWLVCKQRELQFIEPLAEAFQVAAFVASDSIGFGQAQHFAFNPVFHFFMDDCGFSTVGVNQWADG